MGSHYKGSQAEITALNAFISLTRASDTVGLRIGKELPSHGLTEPQFGVLEALLHLGPLDQHVLGDKLLVSGGNITFIVDKLVKADYVKRIQSSCDRRCNTVHLTDKGRKLIESVFPLHLEFIISMMGALSSDDQAELTRICKKLGLANKTN